MKLRRTYFTYAPFLVPFAGCAEVAVEQVVAAEGDERLLLLPVAPFQDALHGGLEIVVAEAVGHTAQMMEGGDVPGKECLLPLRGKGHGKGFARVAQP